MGLRSQSAYHFYDMQPVQASLYEEVTEGLIRNPKSIPPKFFYDEQGSKLFDGICDTPEYYLTRAEKQILEIHQSEISALTGSGCLLIEPGSGSSQKVRGLLDSLNPRAYMPMDISGDYLQSVTQEMATEYPWLNLHVTCTDYTQPLVLPYNPSGVRKVAFFPGSSIGNFEPNLAVSFLSNIANMVEQEGALLIGVDLKKDPDILNAAYNDARGLTGAFNLNLLTHINRELNANFDLDNFKHHAFYNEDQGRIEMHLVSLKRQNVQIGDFDCRIEKNESIHTENSYKYHLSEFQELAAKAGLQPEMSWTDPDDLFSFHYLTVT